MWSQLENQYNISLVTKLEDELIQISKQVQSLEEETQSLQIVEGRQKNAMKDFNKQKENHEKVSNLNNALR